MRVLTVGNHETSAAVLRDVLARGGHELLTASDGRAALEMLRLGSIPLVIVHRDLPEMSGSDLCRAIRVSDSGSSVYLMLLSSLAQTDTAAALAAGADDVMTEPLDPAEVTMRLRLSERVLSLESRDLTIFALARLTESRDPEAGAHLERVCGYSRLLAEELAKQPQYSGEIDGEYIRLLYLTASLHDIGKVAIPDCVLLKPGRLSDREFGMMKEHTTLGAKTLDLALREHPEDRFVRMARDIAATHHERWDGKGYPNHLVGTAIPLCGRIVAVADVYDALTTKRVYKGAFTHGVAKSILIADRETHFDPAVIDAFLACEQQFIEIRERYAVETHADAA